MKFDTVIVGAGVTGLTLARLEGKLGTTCIIAPQVGGLIHGYRHDGFSFDVGGHVYTTGDEQVLDLLTRVGGVQHERNSYYCDGTALVPYPVQSNADKLGITIVSTSDGEYREQNLKDWATGVFGTDFYDHWYAPFNKRVWSTNPSEMDSDWVAGRVTKPSDPKTGWGPNAKFIYAPGSSIEDALLGDALHANAELINAAVTGIDTTNRAVFTDTGLEIQYKSLFDTTRMFTKPFMKANRIVTIGVGFNHRIDDDFCWIYPHISRRAHRVTLLSRYHPSLAPVGCDSIIIEYPYMSRNSLPAWVLASMSYSDETKHQSEVLIPQLYAARLCRDTGIQSLSHIEPFDIKVAVAIDAQAYPVPTMGARTVMSHIKSMLDPLNVYLAGRWGSHGYFNLEHCIKDAYVAHSFANGDRSVDMYRQYYRSSFYYKRQA